MYFVYQITANECIYIGCTNNLRRRKDQHNGNARKRKSKLGIFLNDNGIVLSEGDLVVLKEYPTRPLALAEERRLAQEFDRNGAKMLNDTFTHESTRIGKHIGHTAKEYYVVNFFDHTVTFVKDLRQYCLANGLDNKLLNRTTTGLRYCKNGYKVFHKEDWEREKNQEWFISGEFLEYANAELSRFKSERYAKEYEVRFPDGHCEIVRNLEQFAKDHDLTSGTLYATLTKGKPTKGYQALRRI